MSFHRLRPLSGAGRTRASVVVAFALAGVFLLLLAADQAPLRKANVLRTSRQLRLLVEDNSTFTTDREGCNPITLPKDTFVPIFMLTRDRLTSFKMALESYRNSIETPYEVIVLDHQSSYPPMVEYLDALRQNGTKVVPLLSESWDAAMGEASSTMASYLKDRPEVQYYVFTDPDIFLPRVHPDILLFYAALLKSCPDYQKVGPHLQISDIPDEYTEMSYGGLVKWESQFWTKNLPHMATWNGAGQHFSDEDIDTTFAMRRRDVPFGRCQRPSARVHAPYAAVHTDWYFNSSDPPEDKVWYKEHLPDQSINHW